MRGVVGMRGGESGHGSVNVRSGACAHEHGRAEACELVCRGQADALGAARHQYTVAVQAPPCCGFEEGTQCQQRQVVKARTHTTRTCSQRAVKATHQRLTAICSDMCVQALSLYSDG